MFALSPVSFRPLMIVLGARHPSNPTPANHGFHTLETPWNALAKKSSHPVFATITPIASLIWLHDGIWLSPLPPLEAIAAANRHASAPHWPLPPPHLNSASPSRRPSYIDVLTPLLRGGPLPLDTPSPAHASPALHFTPPLPNSYARESFTRMMRRNAAIVVPYCYWWLSSLLPPLHPSFSPLRSL